MSNWITLTAADLQVAKVSALVDALREAALGAGQADPSTEVIATVTQRIRSEVAGCANNVLDADETKIPRDLKSLALRMILRELQSRLQITLNDDEREEWRQDIRYMERIAGCEIPVAAADTPETEPTVQSRTIRARIATRDRKFTRAAQEGAS